MRSVKKEVVTRVSGRSSLAAPRPLFSHFVVHVATIFVMRETMLRLVYHDHEKGALS